MCQLRILFVVAVFFLLGLIDATPYLSRHKRTSDQRLAELETLIALSKMNGKLVTIPIGFGKIDPNKIGRRKRSVSLLIQQLINDLSAEEKLSSEDFESVPKKVDKEEEEGDEEYGGEERENKSEDDEDFFKESLRVVNHPFLHQAKLPE